MHHQTQKKDTMPPLNLQDVIHNLSVAAATPGSTITVNFYKSVSEDSALYSRTVTLAGHHVPGTVRVFRDHGGVVLLVAGPSKTGLMEVVDETKLDRATIEAFTARALDAIADGVDLADSIPTDSQIPYNRKNTSHYLV